MKWSWKIERQRQAVGGGQESEMTEGRIGGGGLEKSEVKGLLCNFL